MDWILKWVMVFWTYLLNSFTVPDDVCNLCLASIYNHYCVESNLSLNLWQTEWKTSLFSGERPYHCEICAKSFVQTSHLRSHMKTHSGSPTCHFCCATFNTKAAVESHIKTAACKMSTADDESEWVIDWMYTTDYIRRSHTSRDWNRYQCYILSHVV